MKKFLQGTVLALALTVPVKAMATNADAGLYDPAPPEGSVFVRFLRDHENQGSDPASANGKVLDYLAFKEVSSYFVVPQGKVDAAVGAATTSFNAEAGKYYTVLMNEEGKLEVITDPESKNRAKAQVILYNLSGENDISLKTADGKVEIVPDIATGGTAEREVNPVKVPLAIYKGDKLLKDLGPRTLDRSQSYSVVVLGNDAVEFVRSTTNTTR